MMPDVTPAQIHEHGPDGTRDAVIYHVELPGLGYVGKVRVNGMRAAAAGTEQWIAEKLNEQAVRLGIKALRGRLYSPLDLTD